jgi:hypothetical protein
MSRPGWGVRVRASLEVRVPSLMPEVDLNRVRNAFLWGAEDDCTALGGDGWAAPADRAG